MSSEVFPGGVMVDDISRLEEELVNQGLEETSRNALQFTSSPGMWRTAKERTANLSKSFSTRVMPLATTTWRTTKRTASARGGSTTTDFTPRGATSKTERTTGTRRWRSSSSRRSSGSSLDDSDRWETVGPSTTSPRTIKYATTDGGDSSNDDEDQRARRHGSPSRGRQDSGGSDIQMSDDSTRNPGKAKEVRRRSSRGGR
jgi:hypothetical protein